MLRKHTSIYLTLALFLPMLLRAQNAVKPGAFTVEPSTLQNLGFEWQISGDENRNATVQTSYRAVGTEKWQEALPLLRIGGERIFRATEFLEYTVPHLFAGSILDLTPDTEYECRFIMADPDGVDGATVQVHKVRTRSEPKAAEGGRVLHVYPIGWKLLQHSSFLLQKRCLYSER